MKATIRVPAPPNFLTVEVAGKEVTVSIADVADADLSELADRWKVALLASAAKKRTPWPREEVSR